MGWGGGKEEEDSKLDHTVRQFDLFLMYGTCLLYTVYSKKEKCRTWNGGIHSSSAKTRKFGFFGWVCFLFKLFSVLPFCHRLPQFQC